MPREQIVELVGGLNLGTFMLVWMQNGSRLRRIPLLLQHWKKPTYSPRRLFFPHDGMSIALTSRRETPQPWIAVQWKIRTWNCAEDCTCAYTAANSARSRKAIFFSSAGISSSLDFIVTLLKGDEKRYWLLPRDTVSTDQAWYPFSLLLPHRRFDDVLKWSWSSADSVCCNLHSGSGLG